MNTITLDKDDIYKGNLRLINANYALKESEAIELEPADDNYPGIVLKRDVANIVKLIIENIGAKNSIVPVSGYRPHVEQVKIYEDSLMENGKEFTRKYVALPDHSEHQTGLAIDLGLNMDKIDFIRPEFPYEGICEEFREKAPEYGFVERYTESKETITGIAKEPWHFRYVGYPHAKIMVEKNLSLEEYIDYIKGYREDSKLSYFKEDGSEIEIYYVPANMNGSTLITTPSKTGYQISGNNVDGFIVTIWR